MHVGKKQHPWNKWLRLVQFVNNSKSHSNIGLSPFFALYGQECKIWVTLSIPKSKIESGNQMIKDMIE